MLEIAQANKGALYYEAAVAGGIPILRTLANSLASDKITRAWSSQRNFQLHCDQDGGRRLWSYDDALAEAQRLGFTESDPTCDVDGIDAAYKVVILSQCAFGIDFAFDCVAQVNPQYYTRRLSCLAQACGYVVKLVGSIENFFSGICTEVTPTFLPKAHTC